MRESTEKDFFEENGYLIKRNMLDPMLIKECLQIVSDQSEHGELRRKSHDWGFTVHRFSSYPAGRQIIGENPNILTIVKALLAPQKIKSIWTRGCIGILPGAPERSMHIDASHSDPYIIVTGYLSDVDQDGGSFTLIPKSHHIVSTLLPQLQEPDDYYDRKKNGVVLCDEPYFQFTGNAGDVIFWDRTLLHQHTKNTSKETRLAVFTDFRYGGE